jgi:hypothetical protein
MFGAGVLFDLFVEFADVGGGNGGVATGFGLGFLVSASIGGVDKSGDKTPAPNISTLSTPMVNSLPSTLKQTQQQAHRPSPTKPATSTTTTSALLTPLPMDKVTSLNAWHTPPSDKDAKAVVVSVLMLMAMS